MEIVLSSPISAEAEVKKYTLIGDDIYIKRYTNENIPVWYRQLVSDIIAQDNTITDQAAAIAYLESLQPGYSLQITELQNADLTINSSIESLLATSGSQSAAIANLGITKVDSVGAAAIARDTVSAYFADGSAGAWFNNQISTYASNIQANASSVSTLGVTLAGQQVMIEDISAVTIDPVTGYYLGASKLGTAPDGSIVGWQFADGTGVQSTFKIMADNFSVSDGTTGHTPFSISGDNVLFNGVVDFTNTNIFGGYPGTTTINGGLIEANSVNAEQISATAITGKTITGGTIEGTTINGVYINGSVIKTSWIDFSSSGGLTNWKFYTEASPPDPLYIENFARNTDGTYVWTDSPTNYYRLATTIPTISTGLGNLTPRNDSGYIYDATHKVYDTISEPPVFTYGTDYLYYPYQYKYVQGPIVAYPYYKIRRYLYVGVDQWYTLPNINSWSSYLADLPFRQVSETVTYNVIGSTIIFETDWISQSFGSYTFSMIIGGTTYNKVMQYSGTTLGAFTWGGFAFNLEQLDGTADLIAFRITLTSLVPTITLTNASDKVQIKLTCAPINYTYYPFSIACIKTWQFPTLQSV